MDYKEKAIESIEHAEAKAETDFQHWKNVLADRRKAGKSYIDILLSDPTSKNRERWDVFFPIAASLATEFEITSWIAQQPLYVGENTREAWDAYLAMNEEDKKKYQDLDKTRLQRYAFENAFENCLTWHIHFEKMQKDQEGQKKEVEEKVMELRKKVERIRERYRKGFLKPDNVHPFVYTDNEGYEWRVVKTVDNEGNEREDRVKLENPYISQLRAAFSDAVLAVYLEKVFDQKVEPAKYLIDPTRFAKSKAEKPRPSTFADLFSDTEGYQKAINALKSCELLNDGGKYIGNKRAIKPFFDALVTKSLLKTNDGEIFAPLFAATFEKSITGRTLRNTRGASQDEYYKQFISLLSIK